MGKNQSKPEKPKPKPAAGVKGPSNTLKHAEATADVPVKQKPYAGAAVQGASKVGTIPLNYYHGSTGKEAPHEKIIETPEMGFNARRRERCERKCEKAGPKTLGKPNFCVAMPKGTPTIAGEMRVKCK